MDAPIWGLAGWLAFLLLAIPYALKARHPETKAVAAWTIFVLSFTVIAATIYAVLIIVAASTGIGHWIQTAAGALAFLFLIFAPALILATYIIRRPPRRRPRI